MEPVEEQRQNDDYLVAERVSRFERRFPSLAGKIKRSRTTGYYELVWVRHIMECCIDKERVKGALIKVFVAHVREHPEQEHALREFIGAVKAEMHLEAKRE